ncbi:diacylglycerol kinase [Geoalkalibacter subterraneus]|uniref:Diacylglycerol kinase n=2 Tax=Geoalkalibacter subterraneus TaxID=483547 RepID=A0A0B5FTJ4_9BACT|nr:diacylglycerol kinase [Geoalkalibacter subterraneus]
MKIHMIAALALLVLGLVLRVSALEFIFLTLAAIFVLFAELFNTAIEVVVDMVSPDYHPLARTIKDVAAGAVLMASVGAVLLGYLALSGYFIPHLDKSLAILRPPPGLVAVVAILVVVILVVLLKSLTGRGTPLCGGMPSGHSAVAFSIATCVSLSGVGAVYILLSLLLAIMVSHSRLLMNIHTLFEVLAGATLGVVTTLLIFLVFR